MINVTYLIGNGFDLACGLRTRYTDIYEKYCILDSKNGNIQRFKAIIAMDNYKNWTDFEMALPAFGKKINDFDKFSECIQDFTLFMEDCLKEEEDRIDIQTNKQKLSEKIKNDIYHLNQYCLRKSDNVLKGIIDDDTQSTIYNFITFNYTNTLEKCLSLIANPIRKNEYYTYKYNKPIHIHATLYHGILLGLDNEELYKDIPCPDIRRLKNLIDKVHNNARYSNITDQALKILRESDIIVIFGWSMGESDSFWVNNLKTIISNNKNLQLVYIPFYSEPVNQRMRYQRLDREDEQKEFIMEKFEISQDQNNRVHIVTDTDYMKVDSLLIPSKT